MQVTKAQPAREAVTLFLVVAILIVCFVFGGSSRADSYSQFFVRSASVLMGACALLIIRRCHLPAIYVPLVLGCAWGALMLSQLVPLPPSLWTELSGREQFVELAAIAEIVQPWRPISLVPHATMNSALATLVPLATLLCFSLAPQEKYFRLLVLLAAMVAITGVIGVAQVASGGSLYFYEISNRGDAVGIFANRNHQATFLAASVPILAGIVSFPFKQPHFRTTVAVGTAFIVIFPLLFVTGSRQGLILLCVGIAAGFLILRKVRPVTVRPRIAWARIPLGAYAAVAIALATVLLMIFRVGAVERMVSMDITEDLRVVLFPITASMAVDYMPLGAGFGAFPDLFKVVEPSWALTSRYVNHAHNDVLEIAIEGGIVAVALMSIFLIWTIMASIKIWRAPYGETSRRPHLMGLVGSSIIAILLLASLVDYPLRTPFLAALLALSAGFISVGVKSLAFATNKRGAGD